MKRDANLRVIFPTHGFQSWNGGVDFSHYLYRALSSVAIDRGVELTLAHPYPALPSRLKSAFVRGYSQIVRSLNGAGVTSAAIPGQLVAPGSVLLRDVSQYCQETGSIAFPSFYPLPHSSPKWAGYLFDLQHRRIPDLFSRRQRTNRDRAFNAMLDAAPGLLVNSRDVLRDLQAFRAPRELPPTLVLPFTPFVRDSAFDIEVAEAKSMFEISGPYFIICNHLWVHKDHATALRAFANYCQERSDYRVTLVCTGDKFDHRSVGYYKRLVQASETLGIGKQVKFLGLVPKAFQLALLRGSIALLQPTLFEGGPGGGSVFEAAGLGVRSIVSNIPVNLEIENEHVEFFQAGDAIDLARKMLAIELLKPSCSSPTDLIQIGDRGMRILGDGIVDFLQVLSRLR